MNRTEWNASNDPLLMLRWLDERGSGRKFRLWACAVANRVEELLRSYDNGIANEIDRAERLADSLRPLPHLLPRNRISSQRLQSLALRVGNALSAEPGLLAAREVHLAIDMFLLSLASEEGISQTSAGYVWINQQSRGQAVLLRDIFGHLFHADPLWLAKLDRTDEVERLARSIYQECSFADLPILGDALEDAGCTDVEILEHCRESGEHARGCWVIDSILGKS